MSTALNFGQQGAEYKCGTTENKLWASFPFHTSPAIYALYHC